MSDLLTNPFVTMTVLLALVALWGGYLTVVVHRSFKRLERSSRAAEAAWCEVERAIRKMQEDIRK